MIQTEQGKVVWRFVKAVVYGLAGFVAFVVLVVAFLGDAPPGVEVSRPPVLPLLASALVLGVSAMYELVQGINQLVENRFRARHNAREKGWGK